MAFPVRSESRGEHLIAQGCMAKISRSRDIQTTTTATGTATGTATAIHL